MPADIPADQLPSPPIGVGAWADPGAPLVRIYHRDARQPNVLSLRRFGPLYRFDHHVPGEDRAVTYVGTAFRTAVRESIHGNDEWAVCPNRRVALIEPATTPLEVQDLVNFSPSDLGAPDDLGDADWNYASTQAWARAIYDRDTATRLGGIRYWSRFDREGTARSGVNVVLWESAPPQRLVVRAAKAQEFSLHDPAIWSKVLTYADASVTLRQIPAGDCLSCAPV